MSLAAKGNLRSLQMLRAIAATSVVYCHIDTTPDIGTFGVDIFFVLSGFVMAMVIANGQRPYEFAMSRIARIVPLYWFMTTAILVVAMAAPSMLNSTKADPINYLKSLLFIPYFKENGELHPMLAVGWSLNYEMYFYLCILTAILLWRKFYLAITLGLLGLGYLLGESGLFGPEGVAFLSDEIVSEFAFGLIAYELWARGWAPMWRAGMAVCIALLAFVFLGFAEYQNIGVSRVVKYGIPSVLLLLAVIRLEETLSLVHSRISSVLSRIGDASYATYLSHAFVVSAVQKLAGERYQLFDPYALPGVVVIIGVALLAGQILYEVIDKPCSSFFRNMLVKRRRAGGQECPEMAADHGAADVRSSWVDVAKGIGISLVVFGHVWRGIHAAGLVPDERIYRLMDSVVYSFHMPLFFFLAGLFFYDSLLKRGWKRLIANKVDTLIYPLVVWSILQGAVEVALSRWTNGKATWGDVVRLWEPRAQLWFLAALFVVMLLAVGFYSRLSRRELLYVLPSGVLMYFIAGNLTEPSVMDQVMTFFVFFAAGVAFNEYSRRFEKQSELLLALGVASISLQWYFHSILGYTYLNLGLWSILLAMTTVLAVVGLSMVLANAAGRAVRTLLISLGQASMAIYLMHILAGSGVRIVLSKVLHVENCTVHVLAGSILGLLLPFVAFRVLQRLDIQYLFQAPRWITLERASFMRVKSLSHGSNIGSSL